MLRARAGYLFLVLTVVTALVLTACGGDQDVASDPSAGMAAVDSVHDEDAPQSEAAAVGEDEYSVDSVTTGSWDRRVIRSAELQLVVTDLDEALRNTRRMVADAGGFVFEASTAYQDERQVGRLTLDVPSTRFDGFIASLTESPFVERIERESTESQDVTEEFVDLGSRLRNLQASEQRYLELLEDVSGLDGVLALERELTRVRGDIEQIEGRLRYLEQRTDMSRIAVVFELASAPSIADADPVFDLGPVVREAWDASLAFVGGVVSLVVTGVVFFWWIWPLALASWIAIAVLRGRRGASSTPAPAGDTGRQT